MTTKTAKSATVQTIKEIESLIPSKRDIIPIHTSDRANFKFCRRKWGWSSPSKHNLVPKAAVHGIREPLWFGTGIHHALEKYYDPILREDPVVAWVTWFDLQIKGGEVKESELEQFIDHEPEQDVNGVWRVQGLEDIMPFYEEDHFDELRELGANMMKYYKKFAEENDDFETVATEHNFSVPILQPKTDKALYMVDLRVMPEGWEPDFDSENIYGPIMYRNKSDGSIFKQVHARGRMDKIIREYRGRYGIHDYKTTSRLDDDYFRHLELDEQCTTYLWAAEREAQMYNLEYDDVQFINYEAILKAFPRPPKILKNGLPSVDRANESTTAKLFEQCIKERGLEPIFKGDPKLQSYYTWLLETDDRRFINRKPEWRNRMQRENAGIRLYHEAVDMLSDPKLYPNPQKSYGCLNCIFRAPCIAAEDGSDWQSMIAEGYVKNWDR